MKTTIIFDTLVALAASQTATDEDLLLDRDACSRMRAGEHYLWAAHATGTELVRVPAAVKPFHLLYGLDEGDIEQVYLITVTGNGTGTVEPIDHAKARQLATPTRDFVPAPMRLGAVALVS
ncbi:hypothetical protein [Azospirillum sp. sgz302134]